MARSSNQKHRRPVLPPSMKVKNPPKGFCRWCGLCIWHKRNDGTLNERSTWHPECVKVYRIACFSSDQRQAVWFRDRGVCSVCKTDTTGKGKQWRSPRQTGHLWQADHLLPLYLGNGQDMSLFSIGNLVTKCTPCHKAKSVSEAGLRADARKGLSVV